VYRGADTGGGRHDWDEAKAFRKLVADAIVAAALTRYKVNMATAAQMYASRGGIAGFTRLS